MTRCTRIGALVLFLNAACTSTPKTPSPDTDLVSTEQDYFGTRVSDPYRWLEDANSPATKAWIQKQNDSTFAYLKTLPERDLWAKRLTEVSNFARYVDVLQRDKFVLYSHNSGLQNQPVWYMTTSLDKPGTAILDPNAWDARGGSSIPKVSLSPDGRWLAYAVSEGGSDWMTWRVLNLQNKKASGDELQWSKFSNIVWSSDSLGFYYTRYPKPTSDQKLVMQNEQNTVYYHKLKDPQDQDAFVFEMKDQSMALNTLSQSDQEGYLIIKTQTKSSPNNLIHIKSLRDFASKVQALFSLNDAEYEVVGRDKDQLLVLTNQQAPRRRIVRASVTDGVNPALQSLIPEPEGRDAIKDVVQHRQSLIVVLRHDVMNQVVRYDIQGKNRQDIALPGLGTVTLKPSASNDQQDAIFASYTSYVVPESIMQLKTKARQLTSVWDMRYAFDPSQFIVQQVFYPSKDGTRIPMTIIAKKGRTPGTESPTLLYGYGGFDSAVEPRFGGYTIPWLERGGIYAVANIRGGGEYGKEWYDAGRLFNKQNVFDDFIAAGEYLIREKYTSSKKLAIEGRSNGGLLVGAVMTQRPDLFAVAIPAVGVLDLLRFHLFTVGALWSTDYLIPDDAEKFAAIMKYSPLHNVKKGQSYPATLILTRDHDDRVVPAHSYKFAAALQAANKGPNPTMIRIETNVGHGAGAPIKTRIVESADMLAFIARHVGL